MKICTKCRTQSSDFITNCNRCGRKLLHIEPGTRDTVLTFISLYKIVSPILAGILILAFVSLFKISFFIVPAVMLMGIISGIGVFLCRKWGKSLSYAYLYSLFFFTIILGTMYVLQTEATNAYMGIGNTVFWFILLSVMELLGIQQMKIRAIIFR